MSQSAPKPPLDAAGASLFEELERAKQEWEATFDSIQEPIAIVTSDRVVRRANLAFAAASGRPIREVVGGKCHELVLGHAAPCADCACAKAFATGGTGEGEVESARGRIWRTRAFPTTAARDSVVCTYTDVTEERRRAVDVVQAEKMIALGQLAGGVAHEINNPIASILAFSQLMRTEPGRSAEDLEMLAMVEQSAMRCKRIVESMLRFSAKTQERKPVDLRACLSDGLTLFQLVLKTHPKVKLETALTPEVPRVLADVVQVEQVALNLLKNAVQALEGKPGQVLLELGCAGQEVFFRVRDTGPGIPAEVLPRIFEPTFTTKPPGQGSGFGLAIVDRIVREHGGRISVASTPGEGSTFTVSFPAIAA